MALLHKTTMSPTKLEVIQAWLPTQPWFSGDAAALENLGGYRFDDPAGEVGLEGVLLTAGDETTYHVPLTYRAAPIDGGGGFLIGTSEHGVLGTRYLSDAAGDPVFRAVLAATIALGGRQADEFIEDAEGNQTSRDPLVRAHGSGMPGREVPELQDATVETVGTLSRVENETAVLDIVRVVNSAVSEREDQLTLRATWQGQAAPAILALLYAG